ncbi:MAG: hypothetical protein EOO66_25680, partial [Methylobacterium sp.]
MGRQDVVARRARLDLARAPGLDDPAHALAGMDEGGAVAMGLSGQALTGEALAREGAGEVRPAPPLWSEAGTGMIAARSDAPGRGWSHFACTFAGQSRSAQAHRDCTSFVHASEGVRWIVEAGGSGQIETGAARHHILSAHGHNVAWPDGREPGAGAAWPAGSIRLDGAQAHAIGTTVHGPDYRHIRVFVLLDDLSGLAVLDRFTTGDRPVTFTGLVHVGPEIVVALAGPRRAVAQAGRARLSFVPVALTGRPAGLSLTMGCNEHPGALRGFVSDGPGLLRPTAVLRYAIAGPDGACGGLIIAADATTPLYDWIAQKITAISDANSCALIYGTDSDGEIWEGYAYQTISTGLNCDTTAPCETIRAAVGECADSLHEA